jgi:hypothetical protein
VDSKFLSEKLKGREPSEDLGIDWEDNFRINLREIWLEVVDWIYLAHDRGTWQAHVNMVMNIQVP